MWLEGFLERFVRVYLLISKRKGRCWESSSLRPWYYFNHEQLFTHFCYRWSLLYFSIAQTVILICYWVFIWNLFKCLKLELTSFLIYSTTFVLFLLFSSSRESLQLEYILDCRNILDRRIITATLHNIANIIRIHSVFSNWFLHRLTHNACERQLRAYDSLASNLGFVWELRLAFIHNNPPQRRQCNPNSQCFLRINFSTALLTMPSNS